MFKRYWKRISTPKSREPRIPRDTIELIKQMAQENPRWGAKKIHGELLKLEIVVDKRTVKKYMKMVRKKPDGQNWRTFLKNHSHEIWACDFTVIHSLFFKPLYAFMIVAHESRKVVHTAVTTNPTDEWTAQQVREATPWGERPKYLIHNNDSKFGSQFKNILKNSGIKAIKTPLEAPRANAYAERFVRSLREEILDHILIINEAHLRNVLNEYLAYYNERRPHQGLEQQSPIPRSSCQPEGSIICRKVLGGIINDYQRLPTSALV